MGKKKPNLTNVQKNSLAQFIHQHSVNGKPKRGIMKQAAEMCGVDRRTIHRIWKTSMQQLEEGLPIHLSSKMPGSVKTKRVHIDLEIIMACKHMERSTIRRLADTLTKKNCPVSKSTVSRWIQRGLLRAHTNAIKPDLTAPNKLLRLKFTLSHIHFDRILNVLKFRSMNHVIHVDEKWFYITNSSQRFYLAANETEPYRSCKSKRFITKVMFVCAVGRPVFSSTGEVIWDGKVGMFPLVTQEPAQRGSKNRPRGTLETKAIQNVTKNVYKNCIINQVIPAIKHKWPLGASKNIIIQQDNARPHITNNDPEFRSAATSDGFQIELVNQPPNSPDTNINDLGWFRALQSLQASNASYNVDQLVKAVEMSFLELSATTLNKVFLSLQCCMVEILKVRGHNNYKVPHMGKDRLTRANALPQDLQVDQELVKASIQYLLQTEEGSDMAVQIGSLMADLGIQIASQIT